MSKIVYPQYFEIVGITRDAIHGRGDAYVNGKHIYHRIFVNAIIKEEDRTHEVYDEETSTIYVVPEWMIPKMIEKIEYQRMTKDWKNTTLFTGEQHDILRILELVLIKQGENNLAELIQMNRLENKAPEVYDYETLYNKAMEKIDKDILREEIMRLKPIYKLRGENIPQDIINNF